MMNCELRQLNTFIKSCSTSNAAIKNTASPIPKEGWYPAYSASGQDVWLPEYRYSGKGIVVSAVGARCGKCFQADGKWNVTANTHVLLVDESIADYKYCWYLLNDENWWIKSGSGQPFVKVKDSLNRSILLPDLSTQQNIATILDKISEGIALCRKMLGGLDLMVKAKFVEMFGDPTGNSFNLSVKPMTEVCEIIDGDRGKNYPNADEFSDEGYCLFLNAKNVTTFGFNFDNRMYITKEKDNILRKGKLSRGDVVLTTRGTIGNLAFYTSDIPYEHMRINSGMVILRMNRKIINEVFFIEQFKMLLDGIKQKIASGSAQPQLPISAMREINLLLPDIEQQKIFSEFVAKSNKSRLTLQQVLSKMELERKVLMQKYFG